MSHGAGGSIDVVDAYLALRRQHLDAINCSTLDARRCDREYTAASLCLNQSCGFLGADRLLRKQGRRTCAHACPARVGILMAGTDCRCIEAQAQHERASMYQGFHHFQRCAYR